MIHKKREGRRERGMEGEREGGGNRAREGWCERGQERERQGERARKRIIPEERH